MWDPADRMEYITRHADTGAAALSRTQRRENRGNTAIYDCFYHSQVAVNMSEGSAAHMSPAKGKWMRLLDDVYTGSSLKTLLLPELVCVSACLFPLSGALMPVPASLSLFATQQPQKFTRLCVCCLLSLTYDSFTPAVYSDQRFLMEFNPTKNWGDESGENVTKARMKDSPMHADSRAPERRTDGLSYSVNFQFTMISDVMERHVTAAGYNQQKKRAMAGRQPRRGNNLHSLVMELMQLRQFPASLSQDSTVNIVNGEHNRTGSLVYKNGFSSLLKNCHPYHHVFFSHSSSSQPDFSSVCHMMLFAIQKLDLNWYFMHAPTDRQLISRLSLSS